MIVEKSPTSIEIDYVFGSCSVTLRAIRKKIIL